MPIILGSTAACDDCGRPCDADGPHECTVRVTLGGAQAQQKKAA